MAEDTVETSQIRAIWKVLSEIKDDLDDLEDKWEEHVRDSSSANARTLVMLEHINQNLEKIDRVLISGNGQPAVIVRLAEAATRIEDLENTLSVCPLHKANMSQSDEEAKTAEAEAKKAKWNTIGKIAGVVGLSIPGWLSLFGG